MYQPTTEPQAEELQVVTEAALDVELLGLAVQPRAERVVPKVLRVVLALGAPEAALAVDQYGLALQILRSTLIPWLKSSGEVLTVRLLQCWLHQC